MMLQFYNKYTEKACSDQQVSIEKQLLHTRKKICDIGYHTYGSDRRISIMKVTLIAEYDYALMMLLLLKMTMIHMIFFAH
jgi:hypothetical protein